MSRGAEHCGVSQSAASQHVQEVERRLGVTLLNRRKRPLELTQAGRIYSEFCRDVLRREEEFSLSLESLKGDVEGTVRVVSIYSTGLSEMSRLGEQFAARYPTAQLHVEYMRPAWVSSSGRLRRFSRLTPKRRSTSCTCWLAADWLTPQCSAPRLMLLVAAISLKSRCSQNSTGTA